jgi:hypothetical protein
LTEFFHSSKLSLVLLKADFPACRLQRIIGPHHMQLALQFIYSSITE